MIQRPNAVALTICQQAIVERGSGNVTFVNSFTRLIHDAFPTPSRDFLVGCLLTDGRGEVTLHLTLESLDDLEDIFRRSYSITFPDPLRQVRLLWPLSDFSFPRPGRYQLTLWAEQEPIASCTLWLILREASS